MIKYKDCTIEKGIDDCGVYYQTQEYNIGRYTTLKQIKKIIDKILIFRKLVK